jgi:hypothetical protein
MIAVPDNKRIIITENKANLDCTPLLKKVLFFFSKRKEKDEISVFD